ncbi:aspartate 1-decarboxylase [Entomomonas sp. E2T0]|uniref:aspartate 1-decarboxylase n=1 Tax=Entomomonas sp. E2T0 TaxID=2930213 RepID=UPI002228233D|nr:aspartate 1-decarboxylase [Entomomonas sp. E2T0]UYZ84052.1 aspartate 1-decarboxylase [Entomomonas sp. E2T0]
MQEATRLFMYGKIHRCRVTEANLDYVGSITIDPLLLEASGILPYTQIDVVNITNGNRLQTYVIPGTKGAGEICLNGAAAHLFNKGDLAILMAYEQCPVSQLVGRKSKAVMVDDNNQITEIFTYETPSMEQLAAGEVPSRAHERYSEKILAH